MSAYTGQGLDIWFRWLEARIEAAAKGLR
jgi:hypothetical protein